MDIEASPDVLMSRTTIEASLDEGVVYSIYSIMVASGRGSFLIVQVNHATWSRLLIVAWLIDVHTYSECIRSADFDRTCGQRREESAKTLEKCTCAKACTHRGGLSGNAAVLAGSHGYAHEVCVAGHVYRIKLFGAHHKHQVVVWHHFLAAEFVQEIVLLKFFKAVGIDQDIAKYSYSPYILKGRGRGKRIRTVTRFSRDPSSPP